VRNIQGDRCEHRTTPRNELFNPAKSMRTNLEIDESIESKILFYREKITGSIESRNTNDTQDKSE
jgi:hypothetical protein